jgi:hypothetical protein
MAESEIGPHRIQVMQNGCRTPGSAPWWEWRIVQGLTIVHTCDINEQASSRELAIGTANWWCRDQVRWLDQWEDVDPVQAASIGVWPADRTPMVRDDEPEP